MLGLGLGCGWGLSLGCGQGRFMGFSTYLGLGWRYQPMAPGHPTSICVIGITYQFTISANLQPPPHPFTPHPTCQIKGTAGNWSVKDARQRGMKNFQLLIKMSKMFLSIEAASCDPRCTSGQGACQSDGRCLCWWGWTGPNAVYLVSGSFKNRILVRVFLVIKY